MKIFFTLFFILTTEISISQNLVPNGSFEDTSLCPTGGNQLNYSIGWTTFRGTPDYFNLCNNSGFGVPFNRWGYQEAKTGYSYAGLVSFNILTPEFREYIGIQLTQSLIISQKYFVSFYINKSINNSYLSNTSYGNIYSNNIGIELSTVAYSNVNPFPINNISFIKSNAILYDTLNWVKVSGSFIADSLYNYLGIGNFYSDSNTQIASFDTAATLAYYYIDDVCLSTDSLQCDGFFEQISDFSACQINIYPNPAHNYLVVEGNKIESLTLLNVYGRIVYYFNFGLSTFVDNSNFNSSINLNISSYASGIYFIQIKVEGRNYCKKIILE